MNPSDSNEPFPLSDRVLLAAGDEAHIAAFRRLVREANARLDLDIVTDGETAIRWLSEKIGEAECGRPILPRAIFIDVDLPGGVASEALRWIRAQPGLDRTFAALCSFAHESVDLAAESTDLTVARPPRPEKLAALSRAANPRLVSVD